LQTGDFSFFETIDKMLRIPIIDMIDKELLRFFIFVMERLIDYVVIGFNGLLRS